jgi:hypothetical protein
MYVVGMGRGRTAIGRMPIITPRLEDPGSASADERDEHLMLLEAARHHLDIEWTETLAAADAAEDHDVIGYPSTVAYVKHRFNMAGSRANRMVKRARAALSFRATFSAWKHGQISADQADLLLRTAAREPDAYRTPRTSCSRSSATRWRRPRRFSTTGETT